jgi:hypothetical protein
LLIVNLCLCCEQTVDYRISNVSGVSSWVSVTSQWLAHTYLANDNLESWNPTNPRQSGPRDQDTAPILYYLPGLKARPWASSPAHLTEDISLWQFHQTSNCWLPKLSYWWFLVSIYSHQLSLTSSVAKLGSLTTQLLFLLGSFDD